MKNSFGTAITVSVFGESHGPAVGVMLDGIAPGIAWDDAYIAAEMQKRRAIDATATPRHEADEVRCLSGVYRGFTTGAPICLLVENTNTRSEDYLRTATKMRPGHADYTAHVKYNGFNDPRGGGHFSARVTAPLVAAGAVCRLILQRHQVLVGSHIVRCGGVDAPAFPQDAQQLTAALQVLQQKQFPVLDDAAQEQIRQVILQAKKQGDSVGGIIQAAAVGLPAGLGEPFFSSVESVLAALFYSIPAVKGVEFGSGFAMADMHGSQANDALRVSESGQVYTTTNHNGGINGGITNGMPLLARLVFKPTPSIEKPQQTIDVSTGKNAQLELQGRHDPCVLPRARAVVDAMLCIGLVDLCTQQYGIGWQAQA